MQIYETFITGFGIDSTNIAWIAPIINSAPFVLLLAMIFEWLIPYPFFLRLNKLTKVFSALGRKVNKLGNSPKQQTLSGILLPTIIILPLFAFIIALKELTQLPEIIDCIILMLILESRPPRTLAKKINNLIENEKKEEARKILGNYTLRVTTKLSQMGIIKACCETTTLRLLNNFYMTAFWYLAGGIYLALLVRIFTLLSMSFSIKLPINQYFGRFTVIVTQILYILPCMLLLFFLSIIPHKVDLKPIFNEIVTKWPSKSTGMILGALAGLTNIKLGGPRYYMLALYRYPVIGGQNEPTTKDLKKLVRLTSLYIWGTMLAFMAIYVGIIWYLAPKAF